MGLCFPFHRSAGDRTGRRLFAVIALAGELLLLVLRSPFGGSKGDAPAEAVLKDGASYAVGIKMFGEYLLPFEIVGIFLLGAIIGAIVLAKTPTTANVKEHET